MVEKPQHHHVAVPNMTHDEDMEPQLEESRRIRMEIEDKLSRADETAGEMARMLRRIAAAIDRNPRTWDELFGAQERERQ